MKARWGNKPWQLGYPRKTVKYMASEYSEIIGAVWHYEYLFSIAPIWRILSETCRGAEATLQDFDSFSG